jgi:hypothetical protein
MQHSEAVGKLFYPSRKIAFPMAKHELDRKGKSEMFEWNWLETDNYSQNLWKFRLVNKKDKGNDTRMGNDLAKFHLPSPPQVFFQDYLLGPFLQRRLSLAEQLGWLHPRPHQGGWHLNSINVVETQCVKAGALRDTINWLKMANA